MNAPVQSFQNRVLDLLEPVDLDMLRPHLESVMFKHRDSLYEAHRPILYVYFPVTGVASLVNTMANGDASEVGTIGNEGIVGFPVLMGDQMAPTSVYIQVPGAGLRLQASVLIKVFAQSDSARRVMLKYAHAFFNQVAQSAACNHFHLLEQRCCRWLLMTHDRVQSEDFLLTQEFLGMMLGVTRSSVTDVMSRLKDNKTVKYSRGSRHNPRSAETRAELVRMLSGL